MRAVLAILAVASVGQAQDLRGVAESGDPAPIAPEHERLAFVFNGDEKPMDVVVHRLAAEVDLAPGEAFSWADDAIVVAGPRPVELRTGTTMVLRDGEERVRSRATTSIAVVNRAGASRAVALFELAATHIVTVPAAGYADLCRRCYVDLPDGQRFVVGSGTLISVKLGRPEIWRVCHREPN